MNRLSLFFLLPSGFGNTQKYQPQFSTAGFYQTNKSVREAINFNVGWSFIKQDVTGAEKHDFDDSAWSVLNLPDCLELLPLAAKRTIHKTGLQTRETNHQKSIAIKMKSNAILKIFVANDYGDLGTVEYSCNSSFEEVLIPLNNSTSLSGTTKLKI